MEICINCALKWVQENWLLLPPIQRSLVWTNEQIINYWDSLLRGFPPGLMMFHKASNKGRKFDGNTVETSDGVFQLFDVQQRVNAILLGFGSGQLSDTHKLWVDFGKNQNPDLKFQLRINSIGQPFGYIPGAPNQKIELKERREKWNEKNFNKGSTPSEVFQNVQGKDLIYAQCAVLFKDIIESLNGDGQNITNSLSIPREYEDTYKKFIESLNIALKSHIIFQEVSSEIVADEKEYIRFFTRVGQGGTRLSDDELTYSIIKYHYPHIHDRMKDIMKGSPGRFAGEVDLVLSALRVAKTLTSWENAQEWEVIGRPSPVFVSKLNSIKDVENKFLELIPDNTQAEEKSLEIYLSDIRESLVYSDECINGLPAMLLAQLPRELVDVLILFFALNWGSKETEGNKCKDYLQKFVLHLFCL